MHIRLFSKIIISILFVGSLIAMEKEEPVSEVKTSDTALFIQSILDTLEIGKDQLIISEEAGYCFINNADCTRPFFKGLTGIDSLNYYIQFSCDNKLSKKKKTLINLRAQLASHYKIHLMPKTIEQLTGIIRKLIKSEIVQGNIESFKVISPYTTLSNFWQNPVRYLKKNNQNFHEGIPAIVVIYCAKGKDSAENVATNIFTLCGTQPGLGLTPRFNEEITDLIFYSQGHADEKIKGGNQLIENKELSSRLFPNPIFNDQKTLYNKHFVTTEKEEDYHLAINLPKKKVRGKAKTKKKC